MEWSIGDDCLNRGKNLGSESMDCLVNSQYLASDSSLPLLRCSSLLPLLRCSSPLLPLLCCSSLLPLFCCSSPLLPLLRLPLFPTCTPAPDRGPWPFDEGSTGLNWPLVAERPSFSWSLDMAVILWLVEVFGEQGDSSKLVILQIQF